MIVWRPAEKWRGRGLWFFCTSQEHLTFPNWFDHLLMKSRASSSCSSISSHYHDLFFRKTYDWIRFLSFLHRCRQTFCLSHRNAECLLYGNQMNLIGTHFKDANHFVYYEWCVCVNYSAWNPRKIIIKAHAYCDH